MARSNVRLVHPASHQQPEPAPDQTAAAAPPKPRIALIGFGEPMTLPFGGKGRPHAERTVDEVRKLIEETTLTYHQIAARTGTSIASISRWMQAGGWKRPLGAPRSMHTVPTPRATVYLTRRMLAVRLAALAERYVRELEETPAVDLDKLGQALELWRMARLATMRRTPRRIEAARFGEPMRPVIELCAEGVDLRRAPREALDDFLENRPKWRDQENKPPRSRGRGNRRFYTIEQRHRLMLQRAELPPGGLGPGTEYQYSGKAGNALMTSRPDPNEPPRSDRRAADAMSVADRHRAAVSDADAQPAAKTELARARRVPSVRALRGELELTQQEFAARFRLPLGTVRDWEQGAHRPDKAAQVLLTVIARDPDAVARALERS